MRDFNVSGIPELPERISVETRIISRETARIHNLPYTLDFSQSSNLSVMTPFKLVKSMVSVEVMTDAPNPMRDRSVQTSIETKAVATQCDLNQEEADINFQQNFNESVSETKKVKNTNKETQDSPVDMEKGGFLKFVKENMTSFSNGKLECLLCGEIKANYGCMESHMALHWGPQKLCFRCGLIFEHKILWKKHNCERKRPSQLQYIKCPHYFCAASLISPVELYDHLNEHCGIQLHKCPTCKASFPTAGELRYHFKLHKICKKNMPNVQLSKVYNIALEDTKYRNRVQITKKLNGQRIIVKRFLSQLALKQSSSRARYCNVCLRRCGSWSHYHEHLQRCLNLYKRRMQRKRVKDAMKTILLNGNNIEID